MADIKPFRCVRPKADMAARVAALPYDVYSREEAYEEAAKDRLSFLNIDRPETQFKKDCDMYAPEVYDMARKLYEQRKEEGVYCRDEDEAYYIYELVMNNRVQTGIAACASIDDYISGTIKKHENTREEKEQDRIRHVDVMNAQTGPIFLTYRSNEIINGVVERTKRNEPCYDFTGEDKVTHRVWKISGKDEIEAVRKAFSSIDRIYIADGHHRAASAAKVGMLRRERAGSYNGDEEFNYFLSVLFPHDQLMIMDYNRVVADLNGLAPEILMEKIVESFILKEADSSPYSPQEKGEFGMYLGGKWYSLSIKKELLTGKNPVEALDVSLLQDYLLCPLLGILDPRTDERIDFVGGIRGLKELEKRCTEGVAFSMYPTGIEELFDVADAGLLMPPKSTWFEPKLRSGIFIHEL